MAKQIINVGGDDTPQQRPTFVATAEAKAQAKQLRLYAGILWVLAIIAEIAAMAILFKKDPEIALSTGKRIMLIVILLIDLVLLIAGSSFWKKANRFDPASNRDAIKFMLQNQLGVVVAAIAFLPVVILAFIKKEYLVGAIAALFMVGGGAASADYHAPSQEQYSQQTDRVQELTGQNMVYWTKSGTKYHLYQDCPSINTSRTDQIFSGTVAKARELKNITELCKICEKRAEKEKALNGGGVQTQPVTTSSDANAAPEKK
jgi:hypothetical protein